MFLLHGLPRSILIVLFLVFHLAAIGCGVNGQSKDQVESEKPNRSVLSVPAEANERSEVEGGQTEFQPVSITAELTPTLDRNWQLRLFLTIAPGWHIDATQESYTQSLEIDMRLPKTCRAVSDWNMPAPQVQLSGASLHKVYTGKLQLTRGLRLDVEPDQFDEQVQCLVTFQACNQMNCRDIESVAVTTRFRQQSTKARSEL